MAISAAELNVILSARDKEFQRKMKAAERRVERFKKRSTTGLSGVTKSFGTLSKAAGGLLPALGGAAIVSQINRIVSSLDNIGKTADRLGLTTDALQELRSAAEQSGVSVNTFDMAMQRFGRRLAEARKGLGEARNAFSEMDIALFDASGNARGMEDVLSDVADAMQSTANQTDRNRLAMKLFDSEGVALVNMLRDGADGMERMRQQARDLGVVIDEDLIRNSEEARTQLDLMSRVINAELSEALIQLAPLLVGATRVVTGFIGAVSSIASFIGENVTPTNQLQEAIDNVTLAMGDQISQTAMLNAATEQGRVMSRSMAEEQLRLARARREEYEAAKLQLTQTKEYQAIQARIVQGEEAIAQAMSQDLPAEFIQNLREQVEMLREHQKAMIGESGELGEAFAQNEANIARLEQALAESEGVLVSFNGEVIEGIELTNRLSSAAGQINYDNAVQSAIALSKQMEITINQAMALMGLLGEAAQAASDPVVFDPRDPRYDPEAAAEAERMARIAERMENIRNETSAATTITNALAGEMDKVSSAAGSANENVEKTEQSLEEMLQDMIAASPALQKLGFDAESLQGVMSTVESSMESAFMSMVDGTKSAEDAFRAMAAEIIKELYRVLVVQRLVGSFEQGGGGILGSLFGAFGGAGRASGGTVQAGQTYMTGESGRELFVPKTDGRILSPAQTNKAMSGSGNGVTVNQTINVSTGVAQTVRTEIKSLMPQIADSAKAAVADAKLRGGSYGRAF